MEKNEVRIRRQIDIERAVLNAFEIALDAQLKAIRRLKSSGPEKKREQKSMSQVDMVYDILRRGRQSHCTFPRFWTGWKRALANVWIANRWSHRW